MRRVQVLRDTPDEANPGTSGGERDPGTTIPGEHDPLSPEEQATKNYETSAREKGWRPQEEFQGDKTSWVSAEEFIKREPLFDRIKGQSKEIKKLNKTVEAMSTHFTKSVNAQVKIKLKELGEERVAAIELGDVKKVDAIDVEIQEAKAEVVEAEPTSNEVTDWVEENKWFTENKEMNQFASAFNRAEFDKTGDATASLKATRAAVEKAYPDYFADKSKDNKQPAGDPDIGGEPKGGGEKGYNMSRLSDDQKLVYNQHVKVHKILSHEEFFKSLEDIGELS